MGPPLQENCRLFANWYQLFEITRFFASLSMTGGGMPGFSKAFSGWRPGTAALTEEFAGPAPVIRQHGRGGLDYGDFHPVICG
jgi:hypothetical protein